MKNFVQILKAGVSANSLVFIHGELRSFTTKDWHNTYLGTGTSQASKNLKKFLKLPAKTGNAAAVLEFTNIIKYQPTEELTEALLAKMPNGKPIKINCLILLAEILDGTNRGYLKAKTHRARQLLKSFLLLPESATNLEVLSAAQKVPELKKIMKIVMQESKQTV